MRKNLIEMNPKKAYLYLTVIIVTIVVTASFASATSANYFPSEPLRMGFHDNYSMTQPENFINQVNGTISIMGNGGFSQLKNITGNGTFENPFVIQNLFLKVANDTGISVADTTSFFVIRNVTIILEATGSGFETGISLDNVTNGEVYNVSIYSPTYPTTYQENGTYLSNESMIGVNIYDSFNDTVHLSHFKNLTAGISIYYSSYISVTNNTISKVVINGIGSEYSTHLHLSFNNISFDHHNNLQIINSLYVTIQGNTLSYADGDNIWLWNTNLSSVISNNVSYDLEHQAILVDPGTGDLVANNTVYRSAQAVVLFPGNNSKVVDNNIFGNSEGIVVGGSYNDTISSNEMTNNNETAINIGWHSDLITIENNYLTGSSNGLSISGVNNVTALSNEIIDNSLGMDVSSSNDVTVYNNYFFNTNNAKSSSIIKWNVTLRPGVNIIGGNYLGGNYWSNYLGTGTNGIGESEIPYNNNGMIQYGGDYLPLVVRQNFTLELGSVDASYNSNVDIPVMLYNGTSFDNLSQTFSFDSSVLNFVSVLNDVSSEGVNFNFSFLGNDIVTIRGNGYFDVLSNRTILYYLIFRPLISQQAMTEVLLDNSTLGRATTYQQASSSVELSFGWTNIGPRNISFQFGGTDRMNGSGEVTDMATSPYYPDVIYAGSGIKIQEGLGGIYRSDNGGNSWININMGLEYLSVEGIVENPYNPNEVVIISIGLTGTNGAIYKSVNGGESWQQTYPEGGLGIYLVNGTIYAATYTSLLVSNDFGSTWSALGTTGSTFPQGRVQGGLILNGGKTIYVGMADQSKNVDYLEFSNDSGRTFRTLSTVNTSLPDYQEIVADPSNQSIMWWLPMVGYSFDGLYYSKDSGRSWNQVNLPSIGLGAVFGPGVGFNTSAQFIAYDPLDPLIMFLGGDGWFYESTDGGKNFVHVIPGPNLDIRFIYVDPYFNGTIFVGSDQGLYVSRDYGKTWVGLDNRTTSLLEEVSVSGNNLITNVADYSSIDSTNFGKSWFENSAVLTGEGGVSATDPYNDSVMVFLTGINLKVSNDGGTTFFAPEGNLTGIGTAITTPPITFKNGRTESIIAFSKLDPSYIYIAGGTGIFLSKDYGKSFYPINESPSSCYSLVLSQNGTLYASNSSGFYASYDGGNKWSKLNNEFAGDNALSSLSIDPSDPSIIAGATNWAGITNAYISKDGGKEFYYANMTTQYAFPAPGAILFLNSSNETALVFMGGSGIYISYDLGQEWQDRSFNLNEESSVTSLSYLNGTAYISTWGEGVLYNTELLNNSYVEPPPLLTYYLPINSTLTVDGSAVQGSGYSTIDLREGNNTITVDLNGTIVKQNLIAVSGSVYFMNFKPHKIPLDLTASDLPSGKAWNVTISGTEYSFSGTQGIISLSVGTYNLTVEPVATPYSIYYPQITNIALNVSYNPISIVIPFKQVTHVSSTNMTSNLTGSLWTTQISYYRGFVIYGGGGNILLLNISSGSIRNAGDPFPQGQVYSICPFEDGFLIAGSVSATEPGIVYYNVSSEEFHNYSALLPSGWNGQFSSITSVFTISKFSFGFLGGAEEKTFFGIVDNNSLNNLTPYLPSYFTPASGNYYSYSGAYLSLDNSLLISDSFNFGIFYLRNNTFRDLDHMLNYSVYIGLTLGFCPSTAFVASNGEEGMVVGTNDANGLPFAALYSPSGGLKDISGIFPKDEQFDTVEYYDGNFIVSGMMSNGSAPIINLYDPSSASITTLGTSSFGDIYLVDSALMDEGKIYFTTFNSKPVPGTAYVADFSYYGEMKPTPTGSVHLSLNVPSTVEIGNQTFEGKSLTIYEFVGTYNISISATGYNTYATSVKIPPLGSIVLNVSLSSGNLYSAIFSESGLPPGKSWSVTLNGAVESSTSPSIVFSVTNGSYSYLIGPVAGFTSSSTSGTLYVNGSNVSKIIQFFPTASSHSSLSLIYVSVIVALAVIAATTITILMRRRGGRG